MNRPVTRPNSFIFGLFGDFIHRAGRPDDAIWIGSLARLMATFGISEAAVRQAVSRMSRQGWLQATRRGSRAFYAVTEHGRRRIEQVSPRVYGPVVEWDGRWRMLTYSVSETTRERRDRLRKDLSVLGWAPLSASTWISPADALEGAREAAESAGVLAEIDLFAGAYCGPRSDRELLERCWDLSAIARAYGEFVERYRPRFERECAGAGLDDEAAFVERLWLVHDFRKFAYIDPGLPSELLPAHWHGNVAAALFREYYARLAKKSTRFFEGVTALGNVGHT
ncbi:MAG TPA: PaaX family transcriptional regulator C-terminal domain-containing protein [Candidatus Baltobacteraceae bacterium]